MATTLLRRSSNLVHLPEKNCLLDARSSATDEHCDNVDALVQNAMVALFRAYGVMLVPISWGFLRGVPGAVTTTIGFVRSSADSGATYAGRLTLSMPSSVVALANGGSSGSARRDDWARELTNQLMGRIKSQLLRFGVPVEIGLPSSIDAHFEHRCEDSSKLHVHAGRTPHGDVLLMLAGMPDESELSAVRLEQALSEGDVVLF